MSWSHLGETETERKETERERQRKEKRERHEGDRGKRERQTEKERERERVESVAPMNNLLDDPHIFSIFLVNFSYFLILGKMERCWRNGDSEV